MDETAVKKPVRLARAKRNELTPKNTEKLSAQVRKSIEAYIKEHRLQPGDQLPTEAELCARFGVSRTAVREALKALEVLGILSLEPGRGTFIRAFDIGLMLRNLPTTLVFQDKDVNEIIEVRRVLERLAVERATSTARNTPSHPLIRELTGSIEKMRELASAGKSILEEDIRFHYLLALLAENTVLLMILEIFWQLRRSFPHSEVPAAITARYERHRSLMDAILKGNIKEAVAQNEFHYTIMSQEMASEQEALFHG